MAQHRVGRIMGIEKVLAVMGGDHKLPRTWEVNTKNDIPDKVNDLLEMVASYDGSGTWFMQKSRDGLAIVLIHEKGKRVYVAASEFWVGDEE